jgi:hypothetical protein
MQQDLEWRVHSGENVIMDYLDLVDLYMAPEIFYRSTDHYKGIPMLSGLIDKWAHTKDRQKINPICPLPGGKCIIWSHCDHCQSDDGKLSKDKKHCGHCGAPIHKGIKEWWEEMQV